ncbi:flippase [Methylotenera versatilis]|uniref:Polysaccharide biosynthesis protein n=1 Tax=Methylotenera versatilis (strain 301) TaxID=666681 RepID=D7DHT3_METV0|nr:flippase [Methylotenera versatilis]ADI29618.1 polysaccharide biosynthesis protein [Methylotenera versatilis 301]
MIKKNIIWNFIGSLLPLLVGVMVFPLIIKAYGTERFGILTIAWSLVGYFSLFDMGLSRALTQMVSEKISKNTNDYEIVEMIHTAFRIMWLLGAIGGFILWLISSWLAHNVLSVSPGIEQETIHTFSILAISIPFVVHTSALRGVMDALQLFKQASLIRMLLGIGTFLGPYFSSLYSNSLIYAAYALVLVRFVGWIMHLYAVNSTSLLSNESASYNCKWLKQLFTFGGWMTISNIIGPLMIYLDRFVIAAMLGTTAVAYYVAPYEVITKLWVIPAAFSGVLFPLFAQEWRTNPLTAAKMLNQGISYVLILSYPAVLLAALFSNEWLAFWLSKEFAVKGSHLVCWLAAGVLVNSVAQIIYAKIQGAGRADWTAKLHLAESIPYWIFLWLAIKQFGIEGAAMAWFFRVSVDTLGLAYFAGKLNVANKHSMKAPLVLTSLSVIPLISSIYIEDIIFRSILAMVIMFLYGLLALRRLHRDDAFMYLKGFFS